MNYIIKKSILAALFIALGAFVLVAAPAPIGILMFAFGLLCVCDCDGWLYTGKCGYVLEHKNNYKSLLLTLFVNLITGWILGFIISYIYPDAYPFAQFRIRAWINPLIHFIQAIGCGVVMYVAVDIKKKHNTPLGIIYGVPLFIFCGLQHSIANIIYCGMGHTISIYILIAIIGNFIGSIATWYLTKN